MKKQNAVVLLATLLAFSSCSESKKTTIIIKNELDAERSFETVELTKSFLQVEDLSVLGIRDVDTKELQVTQLVDENNDGIIDQLLFQPLVDPKSEKSYEVVVVEEVERPEAEELCYSRFVPERTDDYTWENDKVAFRVYGPTAQKMAEDSVKGGTLSSGVDAWLKRVDYPIINKWYQEYVDGTGSYHEDTGEGCDNFHVGISRGVGGIGVKSDSTYYYSKNYTVWKTITTGPIRTSFYLNYEDWDADGKTVTETRVISLDRGNNLSKFTMDLKGIEEISAGLTLHEKDGVVTSDDKNWVSYWEPHADSELGTAIVASSKNFLGYEKYDVEAKDESNAYAHLKIEDNKLVYYAGFGWKKAGEFTTQQEWEQYLNDFSEKIESPLIVTLKNEKD